MIHISLIAAIVACWFGSMLFPAHAQTPTAAPQATVVIQDKPVLLGDTDYYKMEADAEAQWKEVLPKLSKNWFDFNDAWKRLKERRDNVVAEWVKRKISSISYSLEWRRHNEMRDWCGNAGIGDTPIGIDKDAAEQFARLDVRVRLCEEKLPAEVEKAQALQPNSDNRPMSFPGKPFEDKKLMR